MRHVWGGAIFGAPCGGMFDRTAFFLPLREALDLFLTRLRWNVGGQTSHKNCIQQR